MPAPKSLYDANPSSWTPEKITVHPAATLILNTGGPGEFTGDQVGTLLTNLTRSINGNGMLAGSYFGVDTSNASQTVKISTNVTDSQGSGGGAFTLKKSGAGTLQLSGENTYSGQTIVEEGVLNVVSLNSVVNGKASSSLGRPANVESGEILFGIDSKDGDFALVYTGMGETTDRVINLAGKQSTVTFDHVGTGLLKFTSSILISGYSFNKTIVLKGDDAGRGEIAGNIADPHDRAGKATTSMVKLGSGTWILSGSNSYAGPTKVAKGTLSLANERSLGPQTDVLIEKGAMLDLKFQGRMTIGTLMVDGKKQPAGTYDAKSFPNEISGTGMLIVQR